MFRVSRLCGLLLFCFKFWLISVKKSYQKCISRQNTKRLSVEVQEAQLLSLLALGRAAASGLFLGFRVASSSETQGAVNQSRRSMCSSPNLLLLPSAFIQLEDKEDRSAEFRQSNICSVEIYSKVFIEELSLRRTHKTCFFLFLLFLGFCVGSEGVTTGDFVLVFVFRDETANNQEPLW